MTSNELQMSLLAGTYLIAKLSPTAENPIWTGLLSKESEFFSIVKSFDEISIVCKQSQSNLNRFREIETVEYDWSIFKVAGPLDFGMVGILSQISKTLSDANISVFCLSTFDTDYILVKASDKDRAAISLQKSGIEIT